MTATTNSPDPAAEHFPSQEVHDALRIAVGKLFVGVGSEEDVCAVLERLAVEARARHIRVEAMLIVFKTVWLAQTDGELRHSAARTRLLSRLVSTCIDRYYADR